MRQQVNLYQPIFRKQEKILSAKTLAQAMAIIVVGLLGFYAYVAYQSADLERRLESVQAQREASKTRVKELSERFPPRVKDEALERELERVREEFRAKSKAVGMLSSRALGNTEGFAGHLEGFARQRLPEVWLTELAIERGGELLTLSGSTLAPEQVPRYIQRLSQEEALAGDGFQSFKMVRNEDEPFRVDFELRTEPAEEGDEQ